MQTVSGYVCGCCGRYHDELPHSYRTLAPDYWSDQLHGDGRSELSPDLCVIQDEHFFIQGNIEIPILDSGTVFSWGVWVSLSNASFIRTQQLWHEVGRESESPYFGWLSTELPIYAPSTLQLKTHVHTRPVGEKPYIEVEATDHPLALEQRSGITLARIQQIAELITHPGSSR